MRILVTNDDGIHAPGLRILAGQLRPAGEVFVLAPDAERSGASHAITLGRPLRVRRAPDWDGLPVWSADGTPADCVKLAVNGVAGPPPDVVVSGINPGKNVGVNVLYSGTVAAAAEAAVLGLPALAFSVDAFDGAHYSLPARLALAALTFRPLADLPRGTVLNWNVPGAADWAGVRGARITRQSQARFREFFEPRPDCGPDQVWMDGVWEEDLATPDGDAAALAAGWISVTPLRLHTEEPLPGPHGDYLRDLLAALPGLLGH